MASHACWLEPYYLLQNYSFIVMINHNSNIMLCEDSNYSMTKSLAIKDPDCKIRTIQNLCQMGMIT